MSEKIVKNRGAFTLLELIVVIFLLSLLSFFVVSNIKKTDEKREVKGIANLKSIVKGSNKYQELICLKSCKECFLIDENLKPKKVKINLGAIRAYILDDTNQLTSLDFGRVKDERVCFRFIFFPNGSTSKMIIESGGSFYYIPSFFGEIEKFSSLSEAREYWTENSYLLRGGDFY
jgi:prepilin-type N-terminal cleavage/methylation domain-containing protein